MATPITLATAQCKVKFGEAKTQKNLKEVKGVTDISFKLDPKATVLSSATHERAGTYWGPPELTVDITTYAADTDEDGSAVIKSALWHLLKLSQTRDYFSMEFSINADGFDSELYISKLEVDKAIVTSVTPIKVGTDGVQTADFTISCLHWSFSAGNTNIKKEVEADAVDANGPAEVESGQTPSETAPTGG